MLELLRLPGIRKLIILAILIRLLIMPFYFHPDIKTTHFKVSFLKMGIWDIYVYLDKNKDNFTIKENFNYFPLTYFFLGGYQILISPFLGSDFHSWLSDASQTAAEKVGVFRYLFLLKLPYLIFDIIIAFLIVKFFDNIEQKKKAFLFWLFNPFTIILIYVFGNLDIIPVFFTIISLLLAKKGQIILSALSLGLGVGFKAYPLLLLPFLLLQEEKINKKILAALVSIGTLGLIILPYFQSQSFKDAALISGLTSRIVSSGLNIGFGETLMPTIISLSLLFFYGLINYKKDQIWVYYLGVLLILFSFVHFHIQWLLWIAPFAIILFIFKEHLRKTLLILLTVAFLIPVLYQDKSMTVDLLKPISLLYNLLPIPFSIMQKIYDPFTVQSILHGILAGGSLILIWQLLKNSKA